jgi:arginine deiminase
MGLHVPSEISPLRKVCLHRPGEELLNLPPDDLSALLFDDIPFLEVAQQEHDVFADILRGEGVEVVYLEDLVAEAFDAVPGTRERFLDEYLDECGLKGSEMLEAARERLEDIHDNRAFVCKTMAGLTKAEVDLPLSATSTLAALVGDMGSESDLLVPPMPNLYFTRDPFAVIGSGVTLNHMYSRTRRRETLYGKYVFTYHPDYKGVPLWFRRESAFHLEGGDVLNLNEHTLAVGISQRTEPAAIDILAQSLFWGQVPSPIDTIYAFKIPSSRAFMHLDTVFTQIDVDKFTIHPGIMGGLQVFRLRRGAHHGEVEIEELFDRLQNVLATALGLDSVKLIRCGGRDPIAAAREQWNDGSNTLAVSPGTICVYQRNSVTNDILDHEGMRLLVVPSSELSRGRGGPRCMSMPLWRD